MNTLLEALLLLEDPDKAGKASRYFKTGTGQYGEGDVFLGLSLPLIRALAGQYWKGISWDDLKECMTSRFHEARMAALIVLVAKYRHASEDPVLRGACVEFYLAHTGFVNNWDLVDVSCHEILGHWLLDRDRRILYEMAQRDRSLWERRMAMVSSAAFIRKGQYEDTLKIADIFLEEGRLLHDLLQKASGWMLREVGKHDVRVLLDWLSSRKERMPRTMLRYAVEKFPQGERRRLLASVAG